MTCLGSFSHVISVLHLFLLSRCFQRTSADRLSVPLWHNFGLNSREGFIFEMNSRCYGDPVSWRSTRQVPLENRICNPPPLNWNLLLRSALACLIWKGFNHWQEILRAQCWTPAYECSYLRLYFTLRDRGGVSEIPQAGGGGNYRSPLSVILLSTCLGGWKRLVAAGHWDKTVLNNRGELTISGLAEFTCLKSWQSPWHRWCTLDTQSYIMGAKCLSINSSENCHMLRATKEFAAHANYACMYTPGHGYWMMSPLWS